MNYLNKISVHCWGGLGSQLFAWSMAEYLRERFPKKCIAIVLHSSGVTRRLPAINFLKPKFAIKVQDDYLLYEGINKIQSTQKISFRKAVKYILKVGYLVIDANYSIDKKSIKPWTRALRGHYSHNSINYATLNIMIQEINKFKKIDLNYMPKKEKSLGVHYRLGDLMQLPHKTYIKPANLSKIIDQTIQSHKLIQLELYSEDSKLLKNMLGNLIPDFAKYNESEVWDTIIELLQLEYFLGTNSKISLWITVFRIYLNADSHNILPISMKKNIEAVLPGISNSKNISFFDDGF
jgi:hypothetical protein